MSSAPINPYVEPEKRRELWADPPRVPTPAILADQARARQQKERSKARRALLASVESTS